MKNLSSKLDISSGNLTSIKFLKDPSTRGNSPIFSKPKDENEANSSFNKPVNRDSSANFKLSNRVNLVNSIGTEPRKRLRW